MKLIDGKACAEEIKEEYREKVACFKEKYGRVPGLAVIMAGDNPASKVYVGNKMKSCDKVGIYSETIKLDDNCGQTELDDAIRKTVADKRFDGVLVQLPLPNGLNAEKALSLISVEKDVDGFSELNAGRLFTGKKCAEPCTPKGVIYLLKKYGVELKGKNAVVVGRSNIVGKPMATLLLKEDCTVTICHSKTVNLTDILSKADIIVSAIGKPKFITAEMVKDGAIVIDVGMNRDENNKLCGDVDFVNVSEKTSLITPVPGGVGPMTVAMLIVNTYEAALENVTK